ncbi:MAG: NADH-quinone oxidoreductase subunit J [Chloroflexi bacterium]|nr:NADH-quinone oxidoreductase subunit J [Chloroflexota bacterium]
MAVWLGFGVLAGATVAGALGTVTSRNVVHAALFLLVTLIAVAGLFLMLFAEFLALVQVLLYGGAIVLVLLFALMLTRIRGTAASLDNPQRPLAIVAALATVGLLLGVVLSTQWPVQQPGGGPVGFPQWGASLFRQWAIPFELASVVLLVALIGAVVISRPGGEE